MPFFKKRPLKLRKEDKGPAKRGLIKRIFPRNKFGVDDFDKSSEFKERFEMYSKSSYIGSFSLDVGTDFGNKVRRLLKIRPLDKILVLRHFFEDTGFRTGHILIKVFSDKGPPIYFAVTRKQPELFNLLRKLV